jgi:hypothetical protein
MDTTISVSSERGHQQLKKNRLWFELEEYVERNAMDEYRCIISRNNETGMLPSNAK